MIGIRKSVVPDIAEEGPKAFDRLEDDEADHRRDKARQQRRRIKVVTVEDLRRQHCPTEGSAEDGPDARPDARRHSDPPVGRFEVKSTSQERAKPGADLTGGAFAPTRTPRADGQGRRHDLDDDRTEADARGLWCTAEIAASVPCPSASGAMR